MKSICLDFDEIEVDSEIKYQKPFSQMQEIVQEYSIASDESEADNNLSFL